MYNVVPGDFTQDGKLDILVMSQDRISSQLALSMYAGLPEGGFSEFRSMPLCDTLQLFYRLEPRLCTRLDAIAANTARYERRLEDRPLRLDTIHVI